MDEIITLVTNHGLSLTIAVIVLYGGIQVMNTYIKYLNKKLNEDKNKDSFNERHKVSTQINLLINRLMNETNADRIGIYEFHNGEGNLGGMPFIKFSNTYEICNNNIVSVQKEMLNLPCTLFTTFISKLMTEDYVYTDLTKDEEAKSDLSDDIQRQQGILKSVNVLITDVNRKIIGFIGMHICSKEKNITYKEIKKVSGLAKELGAILSLK